MSRPIASLSLDLDNLWSYMKTHGDEGWEDFPSYLDVLVPRVLDFLAERDLTITFFVVGQDAALEKNHRALRMLADAGHEIGCHSFKHEPWLHLYTRDELETELEQAEKAIEQATGVRPTGFRGPGFSLSEETLEVLERRGYAYDTSTLPTFIGPLARLYYFFTAELDDADAEKRKLLFGSFRDGFRKLGAYRWKLAPGVSGEWSRELVELPVTTFPVLRIPFHLSYVIYLSTFSAWLARTYFRMAVRACRVTGVQPTLLLHPLDFLGGDDAPELAFFPAMNMGSAAKLAALDDYLGFYAKHFEVVPVGEHVRRLQADAGRLALVEPRFAG